MFLSSLQLMAKRSLAHWRLLSAVVVGILLAVGIMSTTVVYFDALRELALRHDFSLARPRDLDILIETSQSPVTPETHAELTSLIESEVDARLGWFLGEHNFGIKTATFFPANPGDSLPPEKDDLRRAAFVAMPGIEAHADITAGRWPAPTPPAAAAEDPLVVEAAISSETARLFRLAPGDRFTVAPYWADAHDRVAAEVVGVFERRAPQEPFWRVFDEAFGIVDTSFQFAVFAVPQATLVEAVGPYFPKLSAEYAWRYDTEPGRIRASASKRARAAVQALQADLRQTVDSYRQRTVLPGVLNRFDTRLFFNKVPMSVVLVLIVLVVLYYVATIAGLLVDAQREEIGLLRSRGGTSRQILAVYVTEALGLAALSIPLGPFMAAAAVSAVGALPMFSDLNGGQPLPVEINAGVFRMAALGGALSLLALLVPSIRAARTGLLQHRRGVARPEQLPAFQRYYLDLAALGVVLFLFWQLSQRGSFVAVRLLGEDVVNQVVLAAPAMFLLVVGVVLLRLFPVSMELLGRVLSSRPLARVASPMLVLGLWQMARNPAHHARLSLLLVLTASLGVFAASFGGSLEQSFRDRAAYRSGADARVTGVRFSKLARNRSVLIEKALAETESVNAVTPVMRSSGTLVAKLGRTYQLLAVDPATFADIAWARRDFSDAPLPEELARLRAPAGAGLALPENATRLSVLLRPVARRPDVNIVARISDAQGRLYSINLGTLEPNGADSAFQCPPPEDLNAPPEWCRVGASMSILRYTAAPPQPPLKLEFLGVALLTDDSRQGTRLAPGALEIDDLSATLEDGSEVVLESFDDLSRWGAVATTLNDYGASLQEVVDQSGRPRPGLARLSWGAASPRSLRGVLVGKLQQPIPALVSPSFLAIGDYHAGDILPVRIEGRETLLEIVDTARYFPTLDPNQAPFVVADSRQVWRALGVDGLDDGRRVTEYWFDLADDADAAGRVKARLNELRVSYGNFVSKQELLGINQIDPLAAAGWRALLAIAFFTVLVVSAVGFVVHAQVTFQGRKTELALLRASGLSMRQLLGLVLLEQLLVIGVAAVIGVFMGTRLGATIIPYLGTSGEGLRLVPPLTLQVDWGSFAATFGLIAAVFGIVILTILASVYRMSIHTLLRMGER